MNTYLLYETSDQRRVRWVYDEHHEVEGTYAYDTEEETKAAEDLEYANLESGEWVALGCIIERKCLACLNWHETDSLWGIVIEPDEAKLREYETWSMER